VSGFVAHDHERREAEATTALHHLRDAIDVNDSLFELLVVNVVIERHE
jgi:hypothetical protein